MKTLQRMAGVLLIGLLVAAALLTAGSWVASLGAATPEAEIATGQLPAAGAFQIDHTVIGPVDLIWAANGTFSENLAAPSEEELAGLPDLGTIDLALLLQNEGGNNVRGYVELQASLAFTGQHTIDTTLLDKATTLTVGPEVSGTYANGTLNVTSERVAYTTSAGDAVERQFRLTGSASETAGVLNGEYRETVWGIGLEPYTVVGTFALKDLAITLVPGNNPPVAESLAVQTAHNTPVAVTLNAADPDGSAISYSITRQPRHGTLSGSAPNLTYTPNTGFAGSDDFAFKVNDGELDSAAVTVTITVAEAEGDPGGNPGGDPDNTAPVANPQSITVAADGSAPIKLTGSDGDGDNLMFIIVSQPSNGTLSGSAPNLTYTPKAGFAGTDSFTFKVNDGKLDSAAVTVTITVTNDQPSNTAPVANPQSIMVAADGSAAITLTGSDGDGDSLTFIIVSQPSHGTLSGDAPNLTYTPNAGFTGTDSFTYKVSDGTSESSPVTVTLDVQGDDPPAGPSEVFLPLITQ